MADYIALLTLQIAPERLAEFEAMMVIEAPVTRAFEGCERIEMYVSPSKRGEVLFLEHW